MKTRMLMLALAAAPGWAAILAAPLAAQRQAPPAPGQPEPFQIPATHDFSLPNGMQVTLVPYGEIPKVTVQLVVRSGNVDEGPQQVWLADLTGDLMEEGTTTRSGAEIASQAAGMGGSLGVQVGANTTTVGGSVLSEFTPDMVELVADVARNPLLPASELDRVRADRLRSLSIARSQPQQLAQERFSAALYPDHPYGRVFPTEAMLRGYGVDQLRAFHQAGFHAGRSHLYVVGRFQRQAVEAAVRRAFGDWRGGAAADPSVARGSTTRAMHLVDLPGAVQSTILLGLPVVDPSHPDYVALQVTNALLGGSFGSRITRNIREDKGYTYSPYSSISARYRAGSWFQSADVTTNVTGASLKEIFHEIDRLRQEPPTEAEMQGIRNYLAGTFVLRNSSRGGILSQLAFLELHGLEADWLRSYVPRIHAVTGADVQRIAATYLDPGKMTLVVVGDRSKIEDQLRPYGTPGP